MRTLSSAFVVDEEDHTISLKEKAGHSKLNFEAKLRSVKHGGSTHGTVSANSSMHKISGHLFMGFNKTF